MQAKPTGRLIDNPWLNGDIDTVSNKPKHHGKLRNINIKFHYKAIPQFAACEYEYFYGGSWLFNAHCGKGRAEVIETLEKFTNCEVDIDFVEFDNDLI